MHGTGAETGVGVAAVDDRPVATLTAVARATVLRGEVERVRALVLGVVTLIPLARTFPDTPITTLLAWRVSEPSLPAGQRWVLSGVGAALSGPSAVFAVVATVMVELTANVS